MRRDIPHRFEGEDVLAGLLKEAGCQLTVDEVRFEFQTALEEDPETQPGDIVPLLFETEPRFKSEADAQRLYQNLLGLWDVVEAGDDPLALIKARGATSAPEGGVQEGPVPAAYVTWAWRTLAEAPEREQQRAEDRLENRQGALVDWVRRQLADCEPQTEAFCIGLCVEAHEAFLRAYGERRVAEVGWRDLEAALQAVRAGEADPQRPLGAHQEDMLDEALEADEDPLPAADRPRAGEVVAAVRRALTITLR